MKGSRRLRYVAVCFLALFAVAALRGWVSSDRLSAIYDLPQGELAARLGEHTVLFSSSSQLSDGSRHRESFKRLSGAMPAGELSVPNEAVCRADIDPAIGKCKVLLLPASAGASYIFLENSQAVPLASGTYQIYYIGSGFWGIAGITLS